MRAINSEDLPWEELIMRFAWQALDLFKQYGDLYQISGTYRTLASCSNEQGRYEDALHYLSEALGYVNRHHENITIVRIPWTGFVRMFPWLPLPLNWNGLMTMV